MSKKGNRSITLISSFGQTGREGRLPYSLSKHALREPQRRWLWS